MNLSQLKALFVSVGAQRLLAKTLTDNDNSKNQVYFGPGFDALHLFHVRDIIPSYDAKDPIFKAPVTFGWLTNEGKIAPAPGAQLILYPQYPEVRFSGFLRGCKAPPTALMTVRRRGRVLFLGIGINRQVFGFVADVNSEIANEFESNRILDSDKIFHEISLPAVSSIQTAQEKLLGELRRIHNKGWITSKQLGKDGSLKPCTAMQCGGFTLEAELGIPKNSDATPDFMGWEIKQHGVRNLDKVASSDPISLMTPEPDGGFYGENGTADFVRKFGYADKKGTVDRINFGGRHYVGHLCKTTNLTLELQGFDAKKGLISNPDGYLALLTQNGTVAASWSFGKLIRHWSEKHALAAYVPSIRRDDPERQYQYGQNVRLAEKTDACYLMRALANGTVFYDPGMKLTDASSAGAKSKPRSQFRVLSKNVPALYQHVKLVTL